MDQEHLRALLGQIEAELRNPSLDDNARQHLLATEADIRRAIEPPLADEAPVLPVDQQERQGRLQAAMVALERSHPQIAAALEKGMVSLSNLGF